MQRKAHRAERKLENDETVKVVKQMQHSRVQSMSSRHIDLDELATVVEDKGAT